MTDIRFRKRVPGLGELALRPLDPQQDTALLHDWLSRDYARFWGMQDHTPEQVAAFYREMDACDHAEALLGLHDGRPAFLVECYDPRHDRIGQHYPVAPGDHGMHVLVAPAERPIRGFTWQVFRTIMDFLFSQPEVQRVVVEPDVRNDKIHALNRRAGFVYQRQIPLPEKTAHLAFCTRDQYHSALIED
ncbi:acetyltransferase [Zobellella denitrificans]|jgi:RimJ/RimL family protein N-acetyltransferase|uniref:Siderophore biosynthesis protein n=1 Tax=Zobellella denitrificans TaxID=347534 RepID=A0A231MZE5_9GAMM|nr:GNAT family N-acetyltransferase [Zobellella denitrificans]ATG75386.1 siderophore biosynthesis protein [Zobellella denitrificans]OXS15419.1 acetyltransferase [Zobellella denitrificans]